MEPRFKFIGFCLSMLPIPGIQQAGAALDRHLSDKDLDRRLQAVWEQLCRLDESAARVQKLEDSIAEIAELVSSNEELKARAREFTAELSTHQREFSAIAETGSFQQFLNVLIEAEATHFGTHGGSTTAIRGAHIRTGATSFSTTGGSTTQVTDTRFQGPGGNVEMRNITTSGQTQVKDASIAFGAGGSFGFGPGGSIGFGAPPVQTLNCGACQHAIPRPAGIKRGALLTCPKCGATGVVP
jgi:hypothetical protein